MRFRQLICPTYKNFYDVCLNDAPFHTDEVVENVLIEQDHCYSRPWVDDPTIATALPRVQLFFNSDLLNETSVDIDDQKKIKEENLDQIHWAPLIYTIIPDTFECPQQTNENLSDEQEKFVQDVRELIDETRIATLCCQSSSCNIVYWRLSIHHIVSQLYILLNNNPNYKNLLDWFHEYICNTFDRLSIGHYVDLFQILYHEYSDMHSAFTEKTKSWPTTSLCTYVYNKLLQKPNDLTEEVIYSITLSPFPIPVICILIPGVLYGSHMQRIQFWQRNLSQITTVILTAAIDKENKSDQLQIQSAYEDIINKFNEIRQLYRNHHIMFLGWNVGCILALKAALVCPVSSVICMSLPFAALSEESKNDFTQINASTLFITGEKQYTNQIDHYRQRLKSRNGSIELGECDDKLFMSEDGKYRFRLTQQLIDKLIMEEIIDFITVLSPKPKRNVFEETDEDMKKKKFESLNSMASASIDDSGDPYLYIGSNSNTNTSTTLTMPPEQDPNSIFLNITLPSSNTTRKRKGSTLVNLLESTSESKSKPKPPTGSKRGRQRTKNLPPPNDLEWAPNVEKRPPKTTTKKSKQTVIPPPPPPPPLPSTTTSILNTLLQLPANQPKQRPTESNLLKTIHQPPSFINTIFPPNPFL